ncbi:MAG: imidazole glycerol phosphate synthase subunit HisF [Chlamydiia bacterium]|nr:imidazole glycerol phosphate synthase subunit HisF [Chlamydiia bacterium]
MLIPRVIPCLLLYEESFVKTVRFKRPRYLGDPVNVINLFNRFEVDEIALLDIRATQERRPPNLELIRDLASECWVPLAYGGGIRSVSDIESILREGVEKVILNSVLESNAGLLSEASREFGSQAIVACLDVCTRWSGGYDVYVCSGRRRLGVHPVARALQLEALGAGEILLNCIHRDGCMEGYDLSLIRMVSKGVGIPVIACGGAGKRSDLPLPIHEAYASAVAAGSIFVFKGPERGVLVNFPERAELEALFSHEHNKADLHALHL